MMNSSLVVAHRTCVYSHGPSAFMDVTWVGFDVCSLQISVLHGHIHAQEWVVWSRMICCSLSSPVGSHTVNP